MSEFDYGFSEFIEYDMSFIAYNDFCEKCKFIKENYENLNNLQKRVFKWYVYSKSTINDTLKNIIWDYLNINDINCYIELLKYKR